jgi:hypothetical protein
MLLALTPEQNTLAIALLIPILGVASPLLLAGLVAKNNRDSKQQDWDRQDIVAERAEKVALDAAHTAELVVERQHSLDQKTDEVARLVASSTTTTNEQLTAQNKKLEEIHVLVNSQMTEALRSELGATMDTLAWMSELMDVRKNDGSPPTKSMLEAYASRELKATELKDKLRVREEADVVSKMVKAEPITRPVTAK